MKNMLLIFCLSIITTTLSAQLYFPPNTSGVWDTIAPSNLGWCQDKIDRLYDFLNSNNTKAFILLKDGKIVLEQYFNGHTASSNWYWASAGKTLTAFMVGMAQQENYLSITDKTSTYLGQGWTSCTPTQEEKITIWHQLTMTSGLDDRVSDPFCTIDTCLQYLADAGTRWAYHNGPYTLLDGVIENATGQTLNLYTNQKVKNPIGMDGLYLQQGYNNVFFSTARSMARFGLLILNKGNWNGKQILTDTSYFNAMVNSSQNLNESYGYLWWLNGKNSYRIPQTQFLFSGSMNPNAPNDMIAALGKNGQFINVIPSQNMVWIRMGDAPDDSLVPFTYNDDIWAFINELNCNTVNVDEKQVNNSKFSVYPNPADDVVRIHADNNVSGITSYHLYNPLGKLIQHGKFADSQYDLATGNILSGFYILKIENEKHIQTIKIMKK